MNIDTGTILIGMDLGQLQDYTAISVVRVIETQTPVTLEDNPNRRHKAYDKFMTYQVLHLERFKGKTYSQALDRVAIVMDHPSMFLDAKELILDASGLGQPVLEMAYSRDFDSVTGVVITGGEQARYNDGKYHVPRTELISCLVSVFQSQRITIAGDLEHKDILIGELSSLQVKKRPSGHEAYESAKATEHDDMVLSLGMAIWLSEKQNTQERITEDAYEADDGDSVDWDHYGLKNSW